MCALYRGFKRLIFSLDHVPKNWTSEVRKIFGKGIQETLELKITC